MDQFQVKIYEFDDFRVDAGSRLLTKNGEQISLTPKVFDTLLYLVENSGKVIEKEELMSAIWTDTIVEENNLSQNISILRRILGEKRGEHRFIATIPGHGFKFVADVRRSEPSAVADGLTSGEFQISDAKLQIKNQSEIENLKSEITEIPNPKSKIQNPKTYAFIAVLLLISIGAAGIYFWRNSNKSNVIAIKSIAVLPFKPLVAENRDEVLEIGMADTLIAKLGNDREIVVRPLSSVRKFGNLEQDAQIAGRELGVDAILDGNIQHWGDKIRVNVRLIGTADGGSIWTGTFDEKMTDIFVVQDAISDKVAAALALQLGGKKRGTENVEAYRFYLQGRYHALKLTPPEIRQGIAFYQQAIAADPTYALAYAGMAQAFAALPITSDVNPNEAFPQAKAAAEKALEIDADLAEARIVLGTVEFWFDRNWKDAETELKKAIALNPNNADAHRFYAVLLTSLGRGEESIGEIEIARKLDPLSLVINALKAQSFFYAERDAEAIEQANKTLEIEPNFWIAHIMLARIYIRQNKFDEAINEAKKAVQFSGGNSEAVSLEAYALAKSGRRDESFELLEDLKSNGRYVPSYNLAMIYNGLENREESLNNLEKAFAEKDARLILLKVEPKWNNLRNEPRFIELMRQMNFE